MKDNLLNHSFNHGRKVFSWTLVFSVPSAEKILVLSSESVEQSMWIAENLDLFMHLQLEFKGSMLLNMLDPSLCVLLDHQTWDIPPHDGGK